MFFVNYRRWFFAFSALLLLGSLAVIILFGLNFGPDFTGGTILEVEYSSATSTPSVDQARLALAPLDLGGASLQAVGDRGLLLRSRPLSEEEHQQVLTALGTTGQFTEKRFNTVGPTLGRELARKGLLSTVLVILLILLYIALVFRKVSRPVSSWAYGLVAVLTMFHDAIIPIGIFVILGRYWGIEIDALSLTALLTILGLSVNDKIVALDRIRENVRVHGRENFPTIVGRSLDETLARSINTSLTIFFALAAIAWFGSESTRYFAIAMAIGMVVATYSSIFIAAPLLVTWSGIKAKK